MSAQSVPSPQVVVIAGSASDAEVVHACTEVLGRLGIPCETRVLSAHRTPRELVAYVEALPARGVKVIVGIAGMAAHLPGVIAAHTRLPVLGVPVAAGPGLGGMDALLSIAQMPGGVPVGCLGVGKAGAKNAAFLACRMLALFDAALAARQAALLDAEADKVRAQALALERAP